MWDEMQRSEGQGGGIGPLLLSAVLAPRGKPAVPGTHVVAEANRKTPWRKHVKEIKEYSFGKD